ncbi:unnamed protein product [marine sediment metagenome]|uniref:Uncharacterized protein n=1 Tax=marine sediment metagenome TaxID=412755 RepID=X1M9C1_9ZZZZ
MIAKIRMRLKSKRQGWKTYFPNQPQALKANTPYLIILEDK